MTDTSYVTSLFKMNWRVFQTQFNSEDTPSAEFL